MRALAIAWIFLGVACSNEHAARPGSGPGAEDVSPDREAWWTEATTRSSSQERILAPRELRALLAAGRSLGFHEDAAWWSERSHWAFARILTLDPDDVEANAGVGRRTLQSIPGFQKTWDAMLETRVENAEISDLLEQYGGWIHEGRPIFLTQDECVVVEAKLGRIQRHLAALAADPVYETVQIGLQAARATFQTQYPFVHAKVGPFLVFFTDNDLARIDGESTAVEDERLAARREYHRRTIDRFKHVYEDLLADLETLYPELIKRKPFTPRTIFKVWIFADAETYLEFADARGKKETQAPYRLGYYDAASNWSFSSYEVPQDAAEGATEKELEERGFSAFVETQAYLAATQVLRWWGRDEKQPLDNRWDVSRAFWLKEGWPAFLAARRVKDPLLGSADVDQVASLPRLIGVIERRSRIQDMRNLLDHTGNAAFIGEPGYTDLAALVVRYLHGDDRRKQFIRYTTAILDGKERGLSWFERAFSIQESEGWDSIERSVYKLLAR